MRLFAYSGNEFIGWERYQYALNLELVDGNNSLITRVLAHGVLFLWEGHLLDMKARR